MTPRRRAILILALLALLLAAIILIVVLIVRGLSGPSGSGAAADESAGETDTPDVPAEAFANPLILPSAATPGRTASQQMAELFAERYGSYSNQGDYQNLRDLLPVMTTRHRQATEAFLETAPSTSARAYEGVTSVKISSDVRSMEDDSAVIAVTLQQTKAASTSVTTGYRTLRMDLVRAGDEWRVDTAVWEN